MVLNTYYIWATEPALQRALEVLLPMVATVETFPVVFKLLATLRMIIDGQTQAALKVSRVLSLGKFGKFYASYGIHVVFLYGNDYVELCVIPLCVKEKNPGL